MYRGMLIWIACWAGACTPVPPAVDRDAPSPADASAATPPAPDVPTPRPTQPNPRAGLACDDPGRRTCDGDVPLRCRDGSGGAVWLEQSGCTAGEACIMDYGCALLGPCDQEGLLSCADHQVFFCGAEGWLWQLDCPGEIACFDGVGCPNPLGIGDECNYPQGARCMNDGTVMECLRHANGARWMRPRPCADGQECVDGVGCPAPAGGRQPDDEGDLPDDPPNPGGAGPGVN